jgi:glycosyltransferase involved in cell wall biosynthesis
VALFFRYLRILRTTRPAIMLTYTIKPNIYGGLAARLLGIPVITNISGLGTAFIQRNWLTRIVILLYKFALHGSACVFFQNADDRDLFVALKLVAPQKTALIPGSGIDLDYFHPQFNAPEPDDAPIAFVLIARLLWDKGIGEYVAAARMVKATYPNIIFRIVGPRGVQNKTAINDAQIAQWVTGGIIEYLGETDDVRTVIAQHDCVVLPSYREGLSRVLLEAAAMGKPLIATDVPGCRQVVDDKINGLLCKPYDAEDLAQAMLKFLQCTPAQRTQMGHESRAKAQREFDQKKVFAAYIEQIAHHARTNPTSR